jgi:hypothetical protein
VVISIRKKLVPQTLQNTVPSVSSGSSTFCPLPGQRIIVGLVIWWTCKAWLNPHPEPLGQGLTRFGIVTSSIISNI